LSLMRSGIEIAIKAGSRKPGRQERLRRFLAGVRVEDKALLKILADEGRRLQQHAIMEKLHFLRGRNSASLRALKAHINAGCKALELCPSSHGRIGIGRFPRS
jgi:hypothetical protein